MIKADFQGITIYDKKKTKLKLSTERYMFNYQQARAEIDERNSVRLTSKLPLLSTDVEIEKLKQADFENEFEAHFQAQRSRYEHLWTDKRQGWLNRMGIYNDVRKKLIIEYENSRR